MKRFLSILLAVALCVSMVPAALAADNTGSVASITRDTGTTCYSDLSNALDEAVSGDTVVLLKDSELSSRIPEDVALVVTHGTTLTITKMGLFTALRGEGLLVVEAGGRTKYTYTKDDDSSDTEYYEIWVGTSTDANAQLQLTSGTVTMDLSEVSIKGTNVEGYIDITLDGEAEAASTWTLSTGGVPTYVTVSNGSSLTITGTLNIANDAVLINNGLVAVKECGALYVSAKGKLNGTGEVGNAGTVAVYASDGENATVAQTIVLTSTGKVYSQFSDNSDLEKHLQNYKANTEDAPYKLGSSEFDTMYSYYKPYTVTTSYDYDEDISYRIATPTTTNGSITVSDTRAYEGDRVTITVKPDDGYELESLAVTTSSGKEVKLTQKSDTKYTFTMPSAKVTITATFSKIAEEEEVLGTLIKVDPTTPFTDISDSRFKSAIATVYAAGLMNGVSETTFDPEGTLTRAMVVTVLYRLAGEPATTSTSAFSDVGTGLWYSDAVAWATESGVVNGYTDGTFKPEQAVTREELAAILYRYASTNGYYVGNTFALDGFKDNEEVQDYAVSAMEWAVANSVIVSRTTAMLDPSDAATRAEVAQALYSLIK